MFTKKALAASVSAAPAVYVEDVFSTWLYTGNGSTQTITNGIDLAGEGGLVWAKSRVSGTSHELVDTVRGGGNGLRTNQNGGTVSTDITGFTSSGFTLGFVSGDTNQPSESYTSWTFRKAAKFFDVVTYTGDGTDQRAISHNLGSAPGFFIVKRTDSTGNWNCYHRSRGKDKSLRLNLTDAEVTNTDPTWNGMWGGEPTSTTFTVNNSTNSSNASGGTYVAYLFAHDAGGFGDSGNDSVVSCGTYTTDASGNATVTLGWEPQWVLVKRTNSAENWIIGDTMRGATVGSNSQRGLRPNTSDAETNFGVGWAYLSATQFSAFGSGSSTYIYIAIRRGPMKTPTDATKVFASALATVSSLQTTWTTNFPVDLALFRLTAFTHSRGFFAHDRLRGAGVYDFGTATTAAESTGATVVEFDRQTTFLEKYGNTNGRSLILEAFRRAPGFFDVVAYTGTGANRTVSHNLGVTPELMIVKRRNDVEDWAVYTSFTGNTDRLLLNTTAAESASSNTWNNTSPTSSVFSVGTSIIVNGSGSTYIAYLFASCPGVSKVGSYTGTGTTLSVDCGFTSGARFVLIKRTDSTGDWYVWDTARGIVSGNDPYLLLNSTAAEVTNTDYIDPLSSGFQISSTAPAAINANGGSFIYLAVA
jgi:hypothetical protein